MNAGHRRQSDAVRLFERSSVRVSGLGSHRSAPPRATRGSGGSRRDRTRSTSLLPPGLPTPPRISKLVQRWAAAPLFHLVLSITRAFCSTTPTPPLRSSVARGPCAASEAARRGALLDRRIETAAKELSAASVEDSPTTTRSCAPSLLAPQVTRATPRDPTSREARRRRVARRSPSRQAFRSSKARTTEAVAPGMRCRGYAMTVSENRGRRPARIRSVSSTAAVLPRTPPGRSARSGSRVVS